MCDARAPFDETKYERIPKGQPGAGRWRKKGGGGGSPSPSEGPSVGVKAASPAERSRKPRAPSKTSRLAKDVQAAQAAETTARYAAEAEPIPALNEAHENAQRRLAAAEKAFEAERDKAKPAAKQKRQTTGDKVSKAQQDREWAEMLREIGAQTARAKAKAAPAEQQKNSPHAQEDEERMAGWMTGAARKGYDIDDIYARGTASAAERLPESTDHHREPAAPPNPLPDASLEDRVKDAYARAPKRSSGSAYISDIRAALPDVPLRDLHQVLNAWQRQGEAVMQPMDDKSELTRRDALAANPQGGLSYRADPYDKNNRQLVVMGRAHELLGAGPEPTPITAADLLAKHSTPPMNKGTSQAGAAEKLDRITRAIDQRARAKPPGPGGIAGPDMQYTGQTRGTPIGEEMASYKGGKDNGHKIPAKSGTPANPSPASTTARAGAPAAPADPGPVKIPPRLDKFANSYARQLQLKGASPYGRTAYDYRVGKAMLEMSGGDDQKPVSLTDLRKAVGGSDDEFLDFLRTNKDASRITLVNTKAGDLGKGASLKDADAVQLAGSTWGGDFATPDKPNLKKLGSNGEYYLRDQLKEYPTNQLQRILKSAGLDTGGSEDDLRERVLEAALGANGEKVRERPVARKPIKRQS